MTTRAWMPTTLLVGLVALLSATAGGQPKTAVKPPKSDPLRLMLLKDGYVAVPLLEVEGSFTVECQIGTETCRMLLDTGSEWCILNTALVQKLGLKLGDEVGMAGIGGVRKGFEVPFRGLTIGDFDTRFTIHKSNFKSADLSDINASMNSRKLPRIDGILGNSFLRLISAVINYPARTLYLRTPLGSLWPEIEGRWVATGGQEDGREHKIDPKAPPKLEFKDRRLHLTDGTKQYTFGLHVIPEGNHCRLYFFDPEKELAKQLFYTSGGILKVSGDKLTVCLCLDPSQSNLGEEFPDDFKAGADSGHLLLEFQREKVAGRPVAAAEPVQAVLEKKGYVAIPFVEEKGVPFLIVECKCGTETVRLLVDTGAQVPTMDTSLMKKLGLKPKNKIIAVGIGGVVSGEEVHLKGLSIGDCDMRSMTDAIPFAALDLTALNTVLVQKHKLRPIDGLLGHSLLSATSAIMDYSARILYLRTPFNSLWTEIEGRWVAVSAQEEGLEMAPDPKAPVRLEFKDRRFHLTDGTTSYTFGLHIRRDEDRYTLAFYDPKDELDKELKYEAGGLLKVSGDKLTVCLCLNPLKAKKGKEFPDDFKPPVGSGYQLMEFRREK